jgi:hypothetical protein
MHNNRENTLIQQHLEPHQTSRMHNNRENTQYPMYIFIFHKNWKQLKNLSTSMLNLSASKLHV